MQLLCLLLGLVICSYGVKSSEEPDIKGKCYTVAINELLCLKNAGAQISLLFFEVNGLDWHSCLGGSSKTAPRILIFSIAIGVDYSYEAKNSEI